MNKLNLDYKCTTFKDLQNKDIKEKLKDIVFVTATDGNHGKGIAWAANKLGCKSVVFMPKGSVLARAKAIENMGNSTVTITDLNYDDAVRKAASLADEKGWYLVQDTAWEGYEDIPNFISQGYTIMAKEALDELNELGIEKPYKNLRIGSGSHAQMTGMALMELEKLMNDISPSAVVVYGDTNSTLAAALAAVKLDIPIVHIEAGPRTYAKNNPEEINRTLVDHISKNFCVVLIEIR